MQTSMARAAETYYKTHVQSRSPLELVVMLYDGAIRFMNEARSAIERQDLVAKREAVSRALAIVSELQTSLDLNGGGEIAGSLDSLYVYVNTRLLDGSMRGDADAIAESIRLFSTLRDAWAQIAVPVPELAGPERA